jgi:3',5'-cyclic AMP phosphodiesterase CpdA
MPAPWSPDALIVHLSDLHFSGYLQNVHGHGEWGRVAKTHDFPLILEMETHVLPLLKLFHQRTVVVVTGDLTAAAEPPAYETVATYLRGLVWVGNNLSVGLGLVDRFGMGDRLFVVPGNHDTWVSLGAATVWKQYKNRRALYQQYFGAIEQKHLFPLVVGKMSLLFFLLDSNNIIKGNLWNLKNVLGRGRVGRHQLAQVEAELNQFSANPSEWPEGFSFEDSIRIGLIHHHPAVPDGTRHSLGQNLLLLEDHDEVREFLVHVVAARLVLCGHQHFPFHAPLSSEDLPNKPWLSCSGTATQRDSKINSFKVYWLRRREPGVEIAMEEYRRDAGLGIAKFRPQPLVNF